jgi:hypothetical protein
MHLLTSSTADVKELTTASGTTFTVSSQDWWRVQRRTWRPKYSESSKSTYIVGYARINGRKTTIQLGRFILGITDPDLQCDHITPGDTLSYHREAIRVATRQEQSRNRRRRSDNRTSKYKGVSRDYGSRKPLWRSQIWVDGTNVTIGRYTTAVKAAAAYNERVSLEFGQFAFLNVIAA